MTVEGTYTIGEPDDLFNITVPSISPYSAPADGGNVAVTIHAGGMNELENIVFVTSFGAWTGETGKTVVKQIPDSVDDNLNVTLNLSSTQAGVATIQVYAEDKATYPSLVDLTQISFYTPASQAHDIILNATQTNIPPSTETSKYSLVVEAKVIDLGKGPVGGAIVDFYLENTTGGGEYITPVSAVTNSAGIARTTFTSGSLSTGSDPASAVRIRARVATPKGCANETTEIQCVDEAALDNNDYFTIYLPSMPPNPDVPYHVWYNIDGTGTDPAPAGSTPIEVAIVSGASQCDVTSATRELPLTPWQDLMPLTPRREITTITCDPDSSGSLLGTNFHNFNPRRRLLCVVLCRWWTCVPYTTLLVPGRTGVQVSHCRKRACSGRSSEYVECARIQFPGFTATISGSTVTVTSAGPVTRTMLRPDIHRFHDQSLTQKCTLHCRNLRGCHGCRCADRGGTGFTIN